MFTHSTQNVRFAFAAFFALVLGLFCQSAWSLEVTPRAEKTNYYSEPEFEDSGSDLLDAVNRDYPMTAAAPSAGTGGGVIYNPRIPGDVDDASNNLVDVVDKYYPPNTSGTIDDPRSQLDPDTMSSDDIIDTIDRLNAGQSIP